ncbi:hypothetical protein CLAIMM_12573 [Cladophialophora immunda]|nr:hypothetical protein CLAIMM_12573 [Cladophialophora immunda]
MTDHEWAQQILILDPTTPQRDPVYLLDARDPAGESRPILALANSIIGSTTRRVLSMPVSQHDHYVPPDRLIPRARPGSPLKTRDRPSTAELSFSYRWNSCEPITPVIYTAKTT